jgi:hypothetical protein
MNIMRRPHPARRRALVPIARAERTATVLAAAMRVGPAARLV